MKFALAAVLMAVLAPHSAVYVKGHSHAADKVRERLATVTCYQRGADPETSAAVLHVDHIVANSGRSWLVMYLTVGQRTVLWQGKAEEYPWPIPSPLDRLLRNMAKTMCADQQTFQTRQTSPNQSPSLASSQAH